MQLTALLYHITPQLLVQSFYALRRDAAVGVDGLYASGQVIYPTPSGQEIVCAF
jgi:hypothetical protein